MFTGDVSDSTKVLLSRLVHTSQSHILIKVADVSKQHGKADCGIFTIAYIISIAFGIDPSLCTFDQFE